MGGAGFSSEKYNAREVALSSDLGRGERLISRDVQNIEGWGSADGSGVPYSSLLRPVSLTAAAGFTMTLGDGDGFFYFPSDPSLTVDDSPYEIIRWRSVPALAFATPDATNPRIDLVVVAPAMVDADLTSRNILVDPGARTIAAQNVYKTSNPSAAVSVVTGTPGATPAPPSVPAGAVALLEVYVPAAAASAAAFLSAPRLFRRAPFPWSAASGIMAGGDLRWNLNVDALAASSTLTMNGAIHRLLIDGELVEFSTPDAIPSFVDTSNNPFGSAPGSDTPYYIYAVGGRHLPQGIKTAAAFSPIALVESLTPPSLENHGRPAATLVTARGTAPATACVYLGIGYVQGGTTNRKPCIMTDDMIYIVGADSGFTNHSLSGTGVQALGTLASRPALSGKVYALLSLNSTALGAEVHLHPDRGDGGGASPTSIDATLALNVAPSIRSQVAGTPTQTNMVFFFNPANPKIWIGGTNLTTGDSIGISAQAYDHRVCRIAAG